MAQNTKAKDVPKGHSDAIEAAVKDWTQDIEGVGLIRITASYKNAYRVDVFTKTDIEHSTLRRNKIERSYFLKCDDENNVVDITA